MGQHPHAVIHRSISSAFRTPLQPTRFSRFVSRCHGPMLAGAIACCPRRDRARPQPIMGRVHQRLSPTTRRRTASPSAVNGLQAITNGDSGSLRLRHDRPHRSSFVQHGAEETLGKSYQQCAMRTMRIRLTNSRSTSGLAATSGMPDFAQPLQSVLLSRTSLNG